MAVCDVCWVGDIDIDIDNDTALPLMHAPCKDQMGVLAEAGHRRRQQPPEPAPGRVREDPRGHRPAQPVWIGLSNAGEQIDHPELVPHRPQRLMTHRI